jgi:trimeric autotransporter adhesin
MHSRWHRARSTVLAITMGVFGAGAMAQPACPAAGMHPVPLNNVGTGDGPGAAGNASIATHLLESWAASDTIQRIHFSGRLVALSGETYASEARFRFRFTNASYDVQPSTIGAFSGFVDVPQFVFDLPQPQIVGDLESVEVYESYNDVIGDDSVWSTLCFAYERATPTSPTIVPFVVGLGPAGSPFVNGDSVRVAALVQPGRFPTSTGLVVTANLIGIGGVDSVTLLDNGNNGDLVAGDSVYSRTIQLSGVPAGTRSIELRVLDTQERSALVTQSVIMATYGMAGQPAQFDNVGAISCGSFTRQLSLPAGQVRWVRVDLPAVQSIVNSGTWVDLYNVDVSTTPGLNPAMAVFDSQGRLVATDNDDGSGSLAELSFGQTSPLHPAGPNGGVGANGRDGSLAGGTYWIAVAWSVITGSASNWRVVYGTGAGGDIALRGDVVASTCATPMLVTPTASPSTASIGQTVRLNATLTRGVNPSSTFTASGSGVVIDATSLDLGIVSLFDDGLHGDGVAFDGVWGRDVVIPAIEGGTRIVFVIANDDQGRSTSATMPVTVESCGRWSPFPGTAAGTNGTVYATTMWDPDADGPLPAVQVVGGTFTMAGGTSGANNVAVWDGTRWSTLGSGFNAGVRCLLATPGGELYAGGLFTQSAGRPVSRIARWNGSEWVGVGSGFDGDCLALIRLTNGAIVAGGTFRFLGSTAADRVAIWQGGAWSPLGVGLSAEVSALVQTPDGGIVAGGVFTSSGAAGVSRIAKWNGSAWTPLGSGMNAPVRALVISPQGELIAGGEFFTAGGVGASMVAKWNGTAWSGVANSPAGTGVNALLYDAGGVLYAGGTFPFQQLTDSPNIARYAGQGWQSVGYGVTPGVRCLANGIGNQVFAGGSIGGSAGEWMNNITRWSGSTWLPLGGGPTNWVTSILRLQNGDIVIAGFFHALGNVAASRIARWDGSQWHPLGTGLSGPVGAMVQMPNGDLVVAGLFNSAGGSPAEGIAKWTGTSWEAIPGFANPNFYASAMGVMPNGDIIVGGNFAQIGGVNARKIARWNGTAWTAMGSGISEDVPQSSVDTILVTPEGELYIGGIFEFFGQTPCNGVAKWNGTDWVAMGSGVCTPSQGAVTSMIKHPQLGLVVSGTFSAIVGQPGFAIRVAAWNGTAWTALGSGLAGPAEDLAIMPNGDIAASESPNTPGLMTQRIARWNGTTWTSLGGGLNENVVALLTLPNGDLVAGGLFTAAGGRPADRLVRWNDVDVATIDTQPADRRTTPASTVQFQLIASGGGALSYEWYREGQPLINGPTLSGSVIAGVRTPALSISNVSDADEGGYRCVVSNACGGTTSDPARLFVGCIADLDNGSGTGTPDGAVTIDDLLYFLPAFEEGTVAADLDDDGQDPALPDGGVTIDDLLFFLMHFEAGC